MNDPQRPHRAHRSRSRCPPGSRRARHRRPCRGRSRRRCTDRRRADGGLLLGVPSPVRRPAGHRVGDRGSAGDAATTRLPTERRGRGSAPSDGLAPVRGGLREHPIRGDPAAGRGSLDAWAGRAAALRAAGSGVRRVGARPPRRTARTPVRSGRRGQCRRLRAVVSGGAPQAASSPGGASALYGPVSPAATAAATIARIPAAR